MWNFVWIERRAERRRSRPHSRTAASALLARLIADSPAERRNRRTPALQGMLQQKGRDERGKQEKAAIRSNAKHHARERQGGRIRLEHALYVPLFVELPEPGGDPLRMLGVERDVRLDLPLDPLCDIRRRIRLDAVCRGAR